MIHLDTNFLIRSLISGTPQARQVDAWMLANEPIGISVVAWAEFLCGPVSTDEIISADRTIDIYESMMTDDSAKAAELFNATGRRRATLADCMIAAIALRIGASLATDNRSDFDRMSGLTLVP